MPAAAEYIVNHYGLHKGNDSIWYLVQDEPLSQNYVGLPDRPTFEVRSVIKRHCPHSTPYKPEEVSKKDWIIFMALWHDPLVQAMSPLPKDEGVTKAPYFYDATGEIAEAARLLARLSNPKGSLTAAVNPARETLHIGYLSCTNIAPLVLTEVRTWHQKIISNIAAQSVHLPRRLVFIGYDEYMLMETGLERGKTKLPSLLPLEELAALPLEAIGATLLRKFARSEKL